MDHVFWLCGLSGSGKSTLADMLVIALRQNGVPVLSLDGDALRKNLNLNLGFSEHDRTENLRRAACIARLGLESRLCTVAAFITPLESQRTMIREIIGPGHVSLVYINAPFKVCQQRDVKGLYAKAANGTLPLFTGLSDRFEPPHRPDLILCTDQESPTASAAKLVDFSLARLAGSTGAIPRAP